MAKRDSTTSAHCEKARRARCPRDARPHGHVVRPTAHRSFLLAWRGNTVRLQDCEGALQLPLLAGVHVQPRRSAKRLLTCSTWCRLEDRGVQAMVEPAAQPEAPHLLPWTRDMRAHP